MTDNLAICIGVFLILGVAMLAIYWLDRGCQYVFGRSFLNAFHRKVTGRDL